MSLRRVLPLLFLAVMAFLYVIMSKINLGYSSCKYPIDPTSTPNSIKCDLSLISKASKDCISEYIRTHPPAFGKSLSDAVKLCTKIFSARLSIAHLHNLDDIKDASKPLHDRQRCNVVTIGIGQDIEAEKQLQFRIPTCKFYGADPAEENGILYEKIGHFVHAAVGDANGESVANVRLGNGRYVKETVKSLSLLSFLNMIKVSIIDYLFLDAEGAEYKLIPYMVKNTNIRICQIAVELHGELSQYGMNHEKFDQMIANLLDNGSYVPVWSRYGSHMHLFLINTQDRYCIDKYFEVVCKDVEDEWKRKPKFLRTKGKAEPND